MPAPWRVAGLKPGALRSPCLAMALPPIQCGTIAPSRGGISLAKRGATEELIRRNRPEDNRDRFLEPGKPRTLGTLGTRDWGEVRGVRREERGERGGLRGERREGSGE